MMRTADTTDPFSDSKTFPALRASAAVTRAAGLGRVSFLDFLEPHSRPMALVPELGSQHPPPGIEHGFAVPGLCERGSVDVADEDRRIAGPGELAAALVEKILPTVGDAGVERPHSCGLTRALRPGERRLEVPVELRRLDVLDRRIGEGGQLLQAQVDSEQGCPQHGPLRVCWPREGLGHRHRHVQIPTAASVLRKAPRAQLIGREPIAIPEREPAALDEHLAVRIAKRPGLERDPPQAPPRPAARAPTKPALVALRPARHILLGDLLKRDRADREPLATRAVQVALQFVRADEAAFPLKDFHRELVAVIPDEVHRAGHLEEHARVLVFDPKAQDANRLVAALHTVQIYSFSNSPSTPLRRRFLLGLNAGTSAPKS